MAYGQPPPTGYGAPAPSPYGAPPPTAPYGAPPPSPYGAPPPVAPSPYGAPPPGAPAPSPYGAPAPSPYGQPPRTAPSPYGAPAPSPYGQPPRPGQPPYGAPPLGASSMVNPDAYVPYTPPPSGQYGYPSSAPPSGYPPPPPQGYGQGFPPQGFMPIMDQYTTLEQVQQALRNAGLTSSNLILGVDYTKSNEETGRMTFGGRCLHYLSPNPAEQNPYQRVIDIIGRTLAPFDADGLIPAYGFGDFSTQGNAVFPFYPDEHPCRGFQEVLQRYAQITPCVKLWGPTSFAPLIKKAIQIVQSTRQYHILVIIADGQVNDNGATREAIVQASGYPISIIMVGVGDGPWHAMKEFDDGLPQRRFDNFQFVDFNAIMSRSYFNFDIAFATAALQEIPEQYNAIRRLRLI